MAVGTTALPEKGDDILPLDAVFCRMVVRDLSPGQWPDGTGGAPIPPMRQEISGLTALFLLPLSEGLSIPE